MKKSTEYYVMLGASTIAKRRETDLHSDFTNTNSLYYEINCKC